jgi:nucleotide-binding universal stress UspA family protein
LMEIQKVDVPDPLESNIRKNRVRFYTKAGAKIFDGVNYILPPIHNGIKAEEMYLMIRPLKQIHYLAKESVVQYIGAIYSTIYQYQNNDLLDTISQKLPPSRDNREMLQKYQSRAKKVLMQTYVDVMEVTANHVAEEVLLTADKKNIDTIVVGSRGISEAKKFLLGSVSYKVSHYAKRPVVIVR